MTKPYSQDLCNRVIDAVGILQIIEADASLADRFAILTSIPGVSTITAFALLIAMPELGALEGSDPFARSKLLQGNQLVDTRSPRRDLRPFSHGVRMVSTTRHRVTRRFQLERILKGRASLDVRF